MILTGSRTGVPTSSEDLRRVREALPPEGRIWVGSGADAANARRLMDGADGLIVGSALQTDGKAGRGVEAARVGMFMDALNR